MYTYYKACHLHYVLPWRLRVCLLAHSTRVDFTEWTSSLCMFLPHKHVYATIHSLRYTLHTYIISRYTSRCKHILQKKEKQQCYTDCINIFVRDVSCKCISLTSVQVNNMVATLWYAAIGKCLFTMETQYTHHSLSLSCIPVKGTILELCANTSIYLY